MTLQLTTQTIERLKRNEYLMTLYDNTYIRREEDPNFIYMKDKFFKGEKIQKIKTLNRGSGFFSSVADIIAGYVGNPDADIKLDITLATAHLCTLSFACLGMGTKIIDGKITPFVTVLNSPGYFRQEGIDYISCLYKSYPNTGTTKNTLEKLYMFVQKFLPGVTENKLYEIPSGILSSTYDFTQLQEVALDTIEQTRGKKEQEITGYAEPAIVLISQDDKDYYPTNSLLEKITNTVYGIDRKIVMFDNEFLKNLDSFVLFSNIELNKEALQKNEGSVMTKDGGRYIVGKEGSDVKFVSNKNELIIEAMKSQEDDLRLLTAQTSIPQEFLGSNIVSGSTGAGSRALIHGAFVKKIERIRSILDKYIPYVLSLAGEIDKSVTTNYSRPDVFGKTDNELLDEIIKARQEKLISRERALMLYNGYTKEQAEEEMSKIKEQEEITTQQPMIDGEDEEEE